MISTSLDQERSRITADLSGVIEGEVRCDESFLQMYACDGSIYQIPPVAVIRPAHTEDVVQVVRYAAENKIPLIPRGAGSNVVGSCLGHGLILDMSHSMRRIESVGREDVIVQPGVVLGDLNRHLKSHGRHIGPDPATRMVTTIGGFLSMNSSGSHWTRYGSARDAVLKLKVVLADGEVVELSAASQQVGISGRTQREQQLSERIGQLVSENRTTIDRFRPKTRINQAGYHLFDLKQSDSQGAPVIDLTRLLVGSEGTLGVITEATLATQPIPRHRGVALLFFHRMESAAIAALEINKLNVVACDLIDRRILTLARQSSPRYQRLISEETEAMLLCEFQDSDVVSLQQKLDNLVYLIQRRRRLAFDFRTTTQIDQRDFYWRIVRRTVPILFKLRGDRRALPFIEDIAVPPEKIPETIQEIHRILNENEVTASIFSHVPQGLISIRPFLSLSRPADLMAMQRLANRIYEKVLSYGGTISGAHGDGLCRTWFLRRQYQGLYDVMGEVKRIFDPENILNPGKIVGHPYNGLIDNIRKVSPASNLFAVADRVVEGSETGSLTAKEHSDPVLSHPAAGLLKPKMKSRQGEVPAGKPSSVKPSKKGLPIIDLALSWEPKDATLAARNCNGCGRCRTLAQDSRMCPMFRLTPNEEASPRAKANLMRSVFTGQLPVEAMATESFKEIVDLCVHCHQCRLECPASVDIPKLMVEAKAQYFAINGMKISDWMMAHLDWLYSIAGNSPLITNFVLRNKVTRWIIDRLFGISQARKLPLIGKTTFLRWAQRQRLHKAEGHSGKKVLYFVDAVVNWNDLELGKAFVHILKKNNIDVLIPGNQGISGMSLIASGALPRAKRLAHRNVDCLAEWIRQGYQIVTTEPSAALALKHEYLNLLEDADAQLVAANTTDAMNYLLQLHRQGELELDFHPLNVSVGYHLPCHQKVLSPEIPGVELLKLIPGLKVELLEKGCSGMAGTFGLKRKNYMKSLRMGFALINAMRNPDIMVGSTECSTCKIQMEQGTTKPTLHPLKIIAKAYRLMPELDNLFSRNSGDHVSS
jgi:FAD/FMN-containing dehydrogenase/Fe-S oxidoreductase